MRRHLPRREGSAHQQVLPRALPFTLADPPQLRNRQVPVQLPRANRFEAARKAAVIGESAATQTISRRTWPRISSISPSRTACSSSSCRLLSNRTCTSCCVGSLGTAPPVSPPASRLLWFILPCHSRIFPFPPSAAESSSPTRPILSPASRSCLRADPCIAAAWRVGASQGPSIHHPLSSRWRSARNLLPGSRPHGL